VLVVSQLLFGTKTILVHVQPDFVHCFISDGLDFGHKKGEHIWQLTTQQLLLNVTHKGMEVDGLFSAPLILSIQEKLKGIGWCGQLHHSFEELDDILAIFEWDGLATKDQWFGFFLECCPRMFSHHQKLSSQECTFPMTTELLLVL